VDYGNLWRAQGYLNSQQLVYSHRCISSTDSMSFCKVCRNEVALLGIYAMISVLVSDSVVGTSCGIGWA
jgi:hypothetical protein